MFLIMKQKMKLFFIWPINFSVLTRLAEHTAAEQNVMSRVKLVTVVIGHFAFLNFERRMIGDCY